MQKRVEGQIHNNCADWTRLHIDVTAEKQAMEGEWNSFGLSCHQLSEDGTFLDFT